MKKQYIAPDICFESFELSADIAAGCGLIGSNSAQMVCPVYDPESGWTLLTIANCDMPPASENDTICYHVPLGSNNVFSS